MAWYKPTAYGTHQERKENARHIRHAQEEEAMQHEIESDDHDCAYTVRVTGGSFESSHYSSYACDECVDDLLARVRVMYPDAQVFKLPSRVPA